MAKSVRNNRKRAGNSRKRASIRGDENYNLERLMAYRYGILYKLMSRYSANFLNERFALSMAEWRILGQLGFNGEGTVAELAARTLTDKAQISRSVQNLVERGLVLREPHDRDGRRVMLYLSSRGVDYVRKVYPHRDDFNQELLEQLTQQERRSLETAIDKLTRYLEAELAPEG